MLSGVFPASLKVKMRVVVRKPNYEPKIRIGCAQLRTGPPIAGGEWVVVSPLSGVQRGTKCFSQLVVGSHFLALECQCNWCAFVLFE